MERELRIQTIAQEIKHKQDTLARKRVVLYRSFLEQMHDMAQENEQLEEELRSLATSMKKYIAALQRLGAKEQLNTLDLRANMLALDKWVTKNEFKHTLKKTSF